MSHGKFKYESQLSSEDVAGYLESLAAGIREREVHLESGDNSVSLRVADDVTFECSARENPEKGRAGFTLSVEWRAMSAQRERTSPILHVVPRSMMDEDATYASDFVDRDSLTTRTPVVETTAGHDRDSADSETADEPALATAATTRRSAPRTAVSTAPASRGRTASRTKTPARKPASTRTSAPTRAAHKSAASRPHARRRAAS